MKSFGLFTPINCVSKGCEFLSIFILWKWIVFFTLSSDYRLNKPFISDKYFPLFIRVKILFMFLRILNKKNIKIEFWCSRFTQKKNEEKNYWEQNKQEIIKATKKYIKCKPKFTNDGFHASTRHSLSFSFIPETRSSCYLWVRKQWFKMLPQQPLSDSSQSYTKRERREHK